MNGARGVSVWGVISIEMTNGGIEDGMLDERNAAGLVVPGKHFLGIEEDFLLGSMSTLGLKD